MRFGLGGLHLVGQMFRNVEVDFLQFCAFCHGRRENVAVLKLISSNSTHCAMGQTEHLGGLSSQVTVPGVWK